jgi:hypothetical protein
MLVAKLRTAKDRYRGEPHRRMPPIALPPGGRRRHLAIRQFYLLVCMAGPTAAGQRATVHRAVDRRAANRPQPEPKPGDLVGEIGRVVNSPAEGATAIALCLSLVKALALIVVAAVITSGSW